MHPVGQEVLFRSAATAGLTGLLCWVVCALVTRAISRHALKPYNDLADHLERLADGDVDSAIDLRGPVAGVRRLARAVVVFQQRDLASQRSGADLQVRYDRLYEEQADERRLLMGMLMDRRLDAEGGPSGLRAPDGPASSGFEIPDADAPTSHAGEVVELSGRLRSSASSAHDRPVGRSPRPDIMPLDFAFIRR